MNPNSANQRWSRWTFTVRPLVRRRLDYENVKSVTAKFARKLFRSAGEMSIIERLRDWTFDIRVEGPPVHDPEYVQRMRALWEIFFEHNFGRGTEVHLYARLEAGSRQDGTPPEQLIILPSISLN